MGTIGKGLIKLDDYKRFGEVADKLSEYCYCINYIPKHDYLVITFHKKHTKEISKIARVIETKARGALVFAKVKWR